MLIAISILILVIFGLSWLMRRINMIPERHSGIIHKKSGSTDTSEDEGDDDTDNKEHGGEPIPKGGFRARIRSFRFGNLILPLVVIVVVVWWMKGYAGQGNGSKIPMYTYAPANGDVLPPNRRVDWTLAVYKRGEEPKTPTGGYASPPEGASFLTLGRYNLDSLMIVDCTPGDTLHFRCWGINHQISDDTWMYLRNGDFDWVVGSGHFPFGAIAAGTEHLEGWVVRDDRKKSVKLSARR